MPCAVEDLFQTLCDCAALNPDPGDGGTAPSFIREQPSRHLMSLVMGCSQPEEISVL